MISLTSTDYQYAAAQLKLPLAVIQAVADVESQGQGFLADGRAVILFERHIFYRQLQQYGFNAAQLAHDYPAIANPKPGGYQGGEAEYQRLTQAQQLHHCACEATSWGAFQVLGLHWKILGYVSIDHFVACMQRSALDQLEAFVRYLRAHPVLIEALQHQRWAAFAKGYNGPRYAKQAYDRKLAQAWEKLASRAYP